MNYYFCLCHLDAAHETTGCNHGLFLGRNYACFRTDERFYSFFLRVWRSATPKKRFFEHSGMSSGYKKLKEIVDDVVFVCVIGLQMRV